MVFDCYQMSTLRSTFLIMSKRIRNLHQTLNHGLLLRNVHRIIKFNQKAWLKLHIDIDPELKKKAKNGFEKDYQADEQCSFWKNHGKCDEKELFSDRIKRSHTQKN